LIRKNLPNGDFAVLNEKAHSVWYEITLNMGFPILFPVSIFVE